MKKIYSIISLILLLSLTGCMQKECKPITKEIVRTVEKIKEVEVPTIVEKYIEVPVYEEITYRYKPGSYFRTKEADGFTYMVYLNVDKAGLIENLFFDKTSNLTLFYLDPETNNLYVKIKGREDEIPNTYRLIRSTNLPTINDAITSFDLIEGYPLHDEIITRLKEMPTTNTRQTNALLFDDDWAGQMKILADKIIKDQTTAAVHLYNSSNGTKTDSVPGVTINVGHEVDLLNQVLLNEASLPSGYVLEDRDSINQGLYKAGTYFNISTPIIENGHIKYNSCLALVDSYGNIKNLYFDEYNSSKKSKMLESSDQAFINSTNKLKEDFIINQNAVSLYFNDEEGNKINMPDISIKDNDYVNKVTYQGIEANGLYEALLNTLNDAYNNFFPQVGNYYFRGEDEYIFTVNIRNVATENTSTYKKGDIVSASELKLVPNERRIIGFTIDKVLQDEEAIYQVKDKLYELYSYNKAYPSYAKEGDFERINIYKEKDKSTYYYAKTIPEMGVVANEKVRFDNKYFDEEKTVEKARGFSTIQTSNGLDPHMLEEKKILNEIRDLIIKENSLLILNETSDGTASNLDSNYNISTINHDLRNLYMISSNSVNTASNVQTPKISSTTKVLADGSYYAINPSVDKGYYTQMTVYNGEVLTMLVDELIHHDRPDKVIFKTQVDDNLYTIGGLIPKFNANIDELVNDYDYSSDAKIDFNLELFNAKEIENYSLAFKTMVQQSLDNKVNLAVNKTVDYLDDLVKDDYIVKGDVKGSLVIPKAKLNEQMLVGTDDSDHYLTIEFDLPKSFELVEDSSSYKIYYDGKSKEDFKEEISYELSFNDQKVKDQFEVEVISNTSLQKKVLNYVKDNKSNLDYIISNYTSIMEDEELTIDLIPEAKNLLKKISDNKLAKAYVEISLDNVRLNGSEDKQVLTLPSTVKFDLVDQNKVGSVSFRIFFDLENDTYGTYQKGENKLEFKLDVVNLKQAKKLFSFDKSLEFVKNYLASEKPIRLDSNSDLETKGITISWTQSINGQDKVADANLGENNHFGFFNPNEKIVRDTYQDGDYYQVDLPLNKSVDLVLTATYKVGDTTLTTYSIHYIVTRGNTFDLQNKVENLFKDQIRFLANIYSALEYRLIDNEAKIYYAGKQLKPMYLNQFITMDLLDIDGSLIPVNIEWYNEKNLPIASTNETFENVLLYSIKGREPKVDEITKTKLIAKLQYKFDDVNIVSYVDFNFNIYNNGITTID